MKKNCKYLKEWLNAFTCILGLMYIVFILKQFLPQFGGFGINRYDIFASFVFALVFSASHFVIASDMFDNRISLKKRIIYCGVPCTLAGMLLSYNLGLQYFIPVSDNVAVASVVWVLSYMVSVGIYVGIFFAIERKNRKQSETYNAALEKYKKES